MPDYNPESNCCEHGIQWTEPSQCARCLQELLVEAKAHARFAFVEGAAWWEYTSKGGTIWPTDRRLAEIEAERRYPGVDWPTHPQRVREAERRVAEQTAEINSLRLACNTADADLKTIGALCEMREDEYPLKAVVRRETEGRELERYFKGQLEALATRERYWKERAEAVEAEAETRIQNVLDVNEQRLDEIQDLKFRLTTAELAESALKYEEELDSQTSQSPCPYCGACPFGEDRHDPDCRVPRRRAVLAEENRRKS